MAKLAAPPPTLTLSQWADAFRYLSSESSSEHGKWHTARAPYQFGIMDSITDNKTEQIILMCSSQVGKTEIGNNTAAYFIEQDPSPILMVHPTLEMAESWSKDRFTPMVRDTPVLKSRINLEKKKDGENTILHKRFPGGHLTISGANSPSSLSARPIRILIGDEVDRYPLSAGKEGDPFELAVKRTTTFHNRKIIALSSPTIKGHSKIESLYENSDKRKFYVPCPHCKHSQTLKWSQVSWPDGQPEEAKYACENCGVLLTDAEKIYMLKKGQWVAEKEFKGIAGFHLNELYSPWSSFGRMAVNFIQAKKRPETLKTFVNTALAETWEEDISGEGIDEHELMEHLSDYEIAPKEVCFITAGVDIQKDRVHIEILGWGVGEESWSLEYIIIHGSPTLEEVWRQVDDILEGSIRHEGGINLKISCVGIDSGGHHTDEVYSYCKRKHAQGRRIYPVKGLSVQGRPIVGKFSRNNSHKVKLFPVGTDTAKDTIFARLKIQEPGPGFCHFPTRYNDDYFKELTAEKLVYRYQKGRSVRQYVKISEGSRNEALDCRVYALAAFKIISPNLEKYKERLERLIIIGETSTNEKSEQNIKSAPKRTNKSRGSGFVNAWKK